MKLASTAGKKNIKSEVNTIAVAALDDQSIVRQSGVGQSLDVVFVVLRPARLVAAPTRLVTEEKPDRVLTVQDTLQVNQANDISINLLLWSVSALSVSPFHQTLVWQTYKADEVDLEVLFAHLDCDLLISCLRDSL